MCIRRYKQSTRLRVQALVIPKDRPGTWPYSVLLAQHHLPRFQTFYLFLAIRRPLLQRRELFAYVLHPRLWLLDLIFAFLAFVLPVGSRCFELRQQSSSWFASPKSSLRLATSSAAAVLNRFLSTYMRHHTSILGNLQSKHLPQQMFAP